MANNITVVTRVNQDVEKKIRDFQKKNGIAFYASAVRAVIEKGLGIKSQD